MSSQQGRTTKNKCSSQLTFENGKTDLILGHILQSRPPYYNTTCQTWPDQDGYIIISVQLQESWVDRQQPWSRSWTLPWSFDWQYKLAWQGTQKRTKKKKNASLVITNEEEAQRPCMTTVDHLFIIYFLKVYSPVNHTGSPQGFSLN